MPDDLTARVRRIEREEHGRQPPAADRAKRGGTTGGRSRATAFARLDELIDEATAGASDAALAQAAGVTMESVLAWRKKRKISRRKKPEQADAVLALDPTGSTFAAALHEVEEDSIAGGTWELPQFVLRDALNYTEFARLLYEMRSMGEMAETIAAAFGLRVKDITLAEEIWKRHLRQNGVVCENCKRIFDARYGRSRTACWRCK